MARNDIAGFFWDDTPPPKPPKKEVIRRTPPEPVWLSPDYLPGLEESLAFNIPLFTNQELYDCYLSKEPIVFDIECYPNYFLIGFKSVTTGKVCYWEMSNGEKLNCDAVRWMLENFTVISFNGKNYDIPIARIALAGKSTEVLKAATNCIINENVRAADVVKQFRGAKLDANHIDLIEVAPLRANLKIYGGRLHSQKMQDLPFPPDSWLTDEQKAIIRLYWVNDLDNTILLYNSLKEEIKLREELGNRYEIDLRSKSDAQIAEAVIRVELNRRHKYKFNIPFKDIEKPYRYNIPMFIKFKTPLMNWVLNNVKNSIFTVSNNGSIISPKVITENKITIGTTIYQMGAGGLHSCEKSICYISDDNHTLTDVDVESYYPRIILNQQLYPEQLGRDFLSIYNSIVKERIAAKHSGKKGAALTLKIVINGSFGKFGSEYSILYSPQLLLQVTITGQLCLLMLIERIELAGMQVVSANTDGVVTLVPNTRKAEFNTIVARWEHDTNFKTEETLYRALYCRDVNNYIAVKQDLSTKNKGAFSNPWKDTKPDRLAKNPTNLICIEAIEAFFTKQIPFAETIMSCSDITKFITVRTVNGGAVKVNADNTEYLGKSVRWYYGKNATGELVYAKSGNKVPRSEKAVPLMQLPDKFPDDVDFDWYIEECNNILIDLGVTNE